jgi:hypothetical protein
MNRAGGIIAIIAGIFAIFAAGVTLLVGGIGGAAENAGAGLIVRLGWGGVIFSFLVITFGAVALGAKSRIPGVLLIVSSISGVVFGGTLVAIFMVLSLIGGILATIGGGPRDN